MKQVELKARLLPAGREARILLQPFEVQPAGGKLIRALRIVVSSGDQTICELHVSPTGFAKAVTDLFSTEIETRAAQRAPQPASRPAPRRPAGSVPRVPASGPSVASAVVDKGISMAGSIAERAIKDWMSKKWPGVG